VEKEKIEFMCDKCGKRSAGEIGFEYESWTETKWDWFLHFEVEHSTGWARCEHCDRLNNVWPRMSVEKRWERRYG
jgi:hypothetical protein